MGSQLLALVQRSGVLGGALHRQSRHVAQRGQQLQRLRGRGSCLNGQGFASCEGAQRESERAVMNSVLPSLIYYTLRHF